MSFIIRHECGNGAWNAVADSRGQGCQSSSIHLVKAGEKMLLFSGIVCDIVSIWVRVLLKVQYPLTFGLSLLQHTRDGQA